MVNLYYIIFGNRRWCQGEEEEKENKRKHVKMIKIIAVHQIAKVYVKIQKHINCNLLKRKYYL